MLPNFPLLTIELDTFLRRETVTFDPFGHLIGQRQRQPPGAVVARRIIREREETFQAQWCLQHPFRREVGLSDDDPVLIVRGNHDFISLSDWIGGDLWEVTDDPTRTSIVLGLKIGGCRGINFMSGRWTDELNKEQFSDRARLLPDDIDVLLTHAPPEGILDSDKQGKWGSSALTSYLQRRSYGRPLRAHFFGHVHDGMGILREQDVLFSNAATTVNVVEL